MEEILEGKRVGVALREFGPAADALLALLEDPQVRGRCVATAHFDAYAADVEAFVLFHIGTHTDLEYCETHIDDCYRTNTIAVENAA